MTVYGQDKNIGVIFLYQSCFRKWIEFNFISKSSTFFLKDPLINEIYQTFANDTHEKGLFFNSIKKGYSYSYKFIRINCPSLLLKIKTFSWSHDIFVLYTSVWSIKNVIEFWLYEHTKCWTEKYNLIFFLFVIWNRFIILSDNEDKSFANNVFYKTTSKTKIQPKLHTTIKLGSTKALLELNVHDQNKLSWNLFEIYNRFSTRNKRKLLLMYRLFW